VGLTDDQWGTIYLQKDLIEHIKENFEAAWAKSIELSEV